MKKILLIFCSLLFITITFCSLRAYYLVQDINISDLNKCFKTKMFQVYLCPGGNDYVQKQSISKHFINLIIISEDAAFYSHKGFDWHEIKQSFHANLRALSYLRGGSTITQQLAKNAFLSPVKSIERKFIEAFLANKIEKKFKKDIILERYMNVIEFGKDLYGIKSASRKYFQKHPSQLSVLESAALVYLVPSPKKYSKIFTDKKLSAYAKKRIATLLRKLMLFKKITVEEQLYYTDRINEFPWKNTPSFETAKDLNTPFLSGDEPKNHRVSDEIIDEMIDEEIENEIKNENLILEDN